MSSRAAGRFPNHGRVTTASLLAAAVTSADTFDALGDFFFGQAVISAYVSITATSTCLASARLDAWAYGQGGYTLALGTIARAAVIFPGPADTNTAIRLVCSDPDKKVLARIRSSLDGRTGYEGGILKGADIDGLLTAGSYYAVIRRVQETKPINEQSGGGPTYAVPAGASDTPSSGYCYVDVNSRISSATQYTIDFRVVSGVLELRINDETTPTVKHNTDVTYAPDADTSAFGVSATGSFEDFRGVGFVSSVDGARVLSASVYSLNGVTSGQSDVLVAVSAGDVYACTDATNLNRIATGAMTATDDVGMVDFAGKVLMVGGGRSRKLDPVTLLVSNWTATAGSLPGYTTAGTTTARGIGRHGTRVALFNIPGDENNVYFTAVADEDDFDTGSEIAGAAFTLSGTRPLKIGQPVVAMQESTNSVSIIGCQGSIQSIVGDPALGNFDTATLEESVGISGLRSMTRLQDGLVVGHAPEGMMRIPTAGVAENFSRTTLSDILTKTRAQLEGISVLVIRDPQRHWVHVFMTPDDGSDGRHVIYDERVGMFQPGNTSQAPDGRQVWSGTGGFYEQSYPADQQPTCGDIWQGKLVLGCLDGYIRTFDDTAQADDGEAIEPSLILGPMDADGIGNDLEIRNIRVLLSQGSDPVNVRVVGALTPESVFDEDRRKVLLSKTIGPWRHEQLPQSARHRCLGLQIRQTGTDGVFAVEAVEASLLEHNIGTSR